jgi:hypothetical protein
MRIISPFFLQYKIFVLPLRFLVFKYIRYEHYTKYSNYNLCGLLLTININYIDMDTAVLENSVLTDTNFKWNPNVPFIGTQDEWWEHFHEIEEGEFMTLDELDSKMETWWKKRCLVNK